MSAIEVTYKTGSATETMDMGKTIGRLLEKGDVLALTGELGGGKTCLTKGIATGLGVGPKTVVTSPSFSLLNEYKGRLVLYHIDTYRLKELDDFLNAGLGEYIHANGITVIEWADKWPELMAQADLTVRFLIEDEETRLISIYADNPRGKSIADRFVQSWPMPPCKDVSQGQKTH